MTLANDVSELTPPECGFTLTSVDVMLATDKTAPQKAAAPGIEPGTPHTQGEGVLDHLAMGSTDPDLFELVPWGL